MTVDHGSDPLNPNPTGSTNPPQSAFVLSGQDYLALPRESTPWIVKSIVPVSGAVLMYGAAKTGKSFAALQLALAIQEGGDWFGFEVEKPGPCLYIQLDTPRPLWADRLASIRQSGVGCINNLLCADRETLNTFPFDITNPQHLVLLRKAVNSIQPTPVAVVIDTIREAHSGDENDSTIMRNVIASLVAATQPAALILVSHSRKPNADMQADIMADNRGSNYVVGRMDTIIRFTKKQVYYSGRSIEEGSLKLQRMDNGLWDVAEEELAADAIVKDILADPNLKTTKERAEVLALKLGKSTEAARSILRRGHSH